MLRTKRWHDAEYPTMVKKLQRVVLPPVFNVFFIHVASCSNVPVLMHL